MGLGTFGFRVLRGGMIFSALFVGWLVLLLYPTEVRAQVFENVEIIQTSSAAEIHVVFNTPIVYEFHRPEKNIGDLIQVHLVLPEIDSSIRLRRERRPSPPHESIPQFTATFPYQETRRTKSLALKFSTPVPFKVIGVQGRNRLVISIPIEQAETLTPLPSMVKKLPSGKTPKSKSSPPVETLEVQESTLERIQREKKSRIFDRVEIIPTGSEAEIHLIFKTRARYLYHFPLTPDDTVKAHLVFPNLPRVLGGNPFEIVSPPSDLIPSFTVVFPDQETRRTKRLTVKFSQSVPFTIRGRDNQDGLIITVPRTGASAEGAKPTQSSEPPSALGSSPLPPSEAPMGTTAKDLLDQGRAALTAGDNEKATGIFNRLLNLPPNSYSQEAQELVGLARERSGELRKAKIEYELYLKLYPEGEGATRVHQRLAVLQQEKTVVAKTKPLKKRKIRQAQDTSVYGNLSQYYYGGHSRIETTTMDAGLATTTNQSTTDQSSLVSSLNLTGRHRHNQYDTKVIFRGSDTMEFLEDAGALNEQRLRRAYVKHENEALAYMLQVGRQPGNSGGILGTYDGGWARYDFTPEFALNLVGGFPEPSTINSGIRMDTEKYFTGGSLDIRLADQNWSGNSYFINQMVNGIVDRQGLGGELRYFANGLSAFSLVDVDLSYQVLNIALLNGSWLTEMGPTLTLLVDHRKTPSMQTTNGIIGSGVTSVREALLSMSEDELRRQAKGVTAESDLVLVGVTHPMTETWQIGGDLRFNHTTSTEAVGTQPVVPASGNIWTYTAQATGTDILLDNHTFTVIGSYINNPTYQGQSIVLNSLWRYGEEWQMDSSVNFYHQEDQSGTMLVRVTPTFRVSYRWQKNMLFEMEGGIEQVQSTGSTLEDSTLRDFFSFGYVWER